MDDDMGTCRYCGKGVKWIWIKQNDKLKKIALNPFACAFDNDGKGDREYTTSNGRTYTNCSPAPFETAQYVGYTVHSSVCAKKASGRGRPRIYKNGARY